MINAIPPIVGDVGTRRTARRHSPFKSSPPDKLDDNQYRHMIARGLTAMSGTQHLRFSLPPFEPVYLSTLACAVAPLQVCELLASRGFVIYGKDAVERVGTIMQGVKAFPSECVIDHPGTTGSHFGLPDGTVVSPEGSAPVKTIYPPWLTKHQKAGRLKDAKVTARTLTGHSFAIFAIVLALAAPASNLLGMPIRRGYELIGDRGTHTHVIAQVAAWAMGSTSCDPMPFASAIANTEVLIEAHRGSLLLIGDPGLTLAGERAARAAGILRDLLASLSGNGVRPSPYLMLGSQSVVDRVGAEEELGREFAGLVTTLRVPVGRPSGVFGKLDRVSASEYARQLNVGIRSNQGQLLFAFVAKLVQAFADDEVQVRSLIDRWMGEFRRWSKIDENDAALVEETNAMGTTRKSSGLNTPSIPGGDVLATRRPATTVTPRLLRSVSARTSGAKSRSAASSATATGNSRGAGMHRPSWRGFASESSAPRWLTSSRTGAIWMPRAPGSRRSSTPPRSWTGCSSRSVRGR